MNRRENMQQCSDGQKVSPQTYYNSNGPRIFSGRTKHVPKLRSNYGERDLRNEAYEYQYAS